MPSTLRESRSRASACAFVVSSGAPVRAGMRRQECRERLNTWLTNSRGGASQTAHAVDRAWTAGEPLGVAHGPDDYGLRAMSDFEYEFEMALMNKHLQPQVEIFFMMTSLECLYVSSSRLKELVSFGASIDEFVPPVVAERLKAKMG